MQGAEIFVPKIPSMKVVDVAKALAPDLPHEMVGIRPGEKLHEVLITEDDSRSTREYQDRFVILPPFTHASRSHVGGSPVAEGFRYASDLNSEWLGIPQFKTLLSQE
jgi:UDP-N-acetylglucosamine 4,6-dehydratase